GLLHAWAALARDRGLPSKAENLYRGALRLLAKLTSAHPADIAYKTGCAGISRLLGDLLLADGRLAEAEKLLKYSVEALEEAVGKYPKYTGYREEAASAWQSLGRLHQAAGRMRQAEKAFQNSIALYEVLRVERPKRVCYSSLLAGLLVGCQMEQLRNAR